MYLAATTYSTGYTAQHLLGFSHLSLRETSYSQKTLDKIAKISLKV
jgi:hypothetical protein